MTQIVNLVLDALVEHLTLKMQTEISPDDMTYVDVVKKGLLQDNKTKRNISIAVTGGDHDDPEYIDGLVSLEKLPNIAMQVPPREIGGGQIWWRRGIVRVECFFIREKLVENEAHDAAYEVLGRLQNNIENAPVRGLVDSYDERAIQIFCLGNTFFGSGGVPKSFIFRGKIFWEVMTERP